MTEPAPAKRPLLRIVGGEASSEELAALVAVLLTHSAATADEPVGRPGWSARADLLRGPHASGPGAWTASGRPR